MCLTHDWILGWVGALDPYNPPLYSSHPSGNHKKAMHGLFMMDDHFFWLVAQG